MCFDCGFVCFLRITFWPGKDEMLDGLKKRTKNVEIIDIIDIIDIIVIKGKMCIIAITDIIYAICHNGK